MEHYRVMIAQSGKEVIVLRSAELEVHNQGMDQNDRTAVKLAI